LKASKVLKDGRKALPCKTAFKIAEKFGVKLIEVGKIGNKRKIKLFDCQLGCF